MKFLKKYPNASTQKRYVNLAVSTSQHKCRICGENTLFKDVVSDYYFCSEECQSEYYGFEGTNTPPK